MSYQEEAGRGKMEKLFCRVDAEEIVYDGGSILECRTSPYGKTYRIIGSFLRYEIQGEYGILKNAIFQGELESEEIILKVEVHFSDDSGVIIERPHAIPNYCELLEVNPSFAVFYCRATRKEKILIRETSSVWMCNQQKTILYGRMDGVLTRFST